VVTVVVAGDLGAGHVWHDGYAGSRVPASHFSFPIFFHLVELNVILDDVLVI
jgi:hypothetical protein